MRRDTTDPQVLALARPLAGLGSGHAGLSLAAQVRIVPVAFYHAVVGQEWSSGDRVETDQLHHFNLSVSGSARIWHGGEAHELRPGTCNWFPGNLPVRRECRGRYECYYLTFRCEWIEGVDLLTEWPGRRPVSLGTWDVAAWRAAFDARPPSLSTLVRLTGDLQARLAAALPDLDEAVSLHARAAVVFPRVFAHVARQRERGAGLPTVAELAAVHGATPGAFAKAFTRSLGVSPKQFLQRRLFDEACLLLRGTDLPIKTIAARLGFSDAFYFTRWFTGMHGRSPGKFRRGA